MAVVVETGTITFPSSNSTVQVSLSNFDASNPPKAIIFFGEPRTSAGGATRQAIAWCMGFSDGTTEGCTLGKARDNVGTTVSTRIQRWDAALVAVDTGASNTIVGLGSVSDLGDDYFDVTFSSISGGGQVYTWVAIGGDDVEAEVVNWAEQEDDETDPKFVATSFTPSALITTSGGIFTNTADAPEAQGFQTSLRISHSFSMASDRYCVAWGDLHNNSNQQTTAYTVNVSGISNTHSGTSTTTNARMTATPTSGGFNVALSNEQNTSSGSYRHTTLALAGATIELHERTSPTSTGNEDIATGLTDVLGVLAIGNGVPKGESATAFGRLFFGAFDGTNQVCRGAGGTDGADPSNNYSWWVSDALVEDWFGGSSQNLSAAVSIVSDTTIRLNWDAVAGTGRSYALLAIGPAPASVSLDVDNEFGFQSLAALPTLGMVTSVENDRADFPSLSGPMTITELPAYVNNLATDSPLSHTTGLTRVNEYRFSGTDLTSDTRRPQGIALKDGIIISQWKFQPSSSFADKQKLILIDPAQGTIGRWRNIALLAVNPSTNKFESFEAAVGGIGVIGNYLYAISNTAPRSIRVFDLREFYLRDSNLAALNTSDSYTTEYPVFLPQVGRIFVDVPEGAGMGWMSATSERILIGNFYDPPNGFTLGGRSFVWDNEVIDDGHEFLIPGNYTQIEPNFPAGPAAGNTVTRIQGGIIANNVLVLSRSWSTTTQNLMALHLAAPTENFFCGTSDNPQTLADKNWLWGCEGICFGETSNTFLTITEFVNARNVSEFSLTELLALVGDPDFPSYDVSNFFGFSDSLGSNYVVENVGNTFGFMITGLGYDYEEDIVQYLGFTARQVVPAINFFSFDAELHDVYAFPIENEFNWTEVLRRSYVATNDFGFTQIVAGFHLEECFNEFEWETAVDSSDTVFGRDMEHNLLKQHLSYTITGARCADKEYAPLVGESGDDSYDEMPLTPPVLGSGTLTLSYPRVAPSLTLVLKNPAFGNTDVLQFTVIDQQTRGGDRILFGDPKWAKSQVLGLQLVNVCEPDVDALLNFLNASLGKEIGLLDWEGKQWAGVIVGPSKPITFSAGGYRVRLEFQGERVV